ncbi:hypothetical protein [Myxococcus sp. RHSTA-1-4]|uniref:hypothetical protein n=1 Tax=Myxococcus sp. RHSTA-1-4 TaxID=2874601 RepID=UPI001CBFA541|nr:hypothetical protein [Myxococcus sp. RHSTA-1-4]MBZ4417164.1 hypothetical protein [Myxococcus sp. RHSTA-1-4]
MASTSGVGGPRAPAPAPKQTAAAETAVDPQVKAAQDLIAEIAKKPQDKDLSAQQTQDYAQAIALDHIAKNKTFLGFLGNSTVQKLGKKLEADIEAFIAKNPTATPKEIKEHMDARFKAQLSSAVVSKGVVDMALKQMQERLEQLREGTDSFDK